MLNKLEKETSMKLKIWEDTRKYSFYVKNSLIPTKSIMTMLPNYTILHKKSKAIIQSCFQNPLPNRFPLITTILNQKSIKKKRRNKKNKILKIAQK